MSLGLAPVLRQRFFDHSSGAPLAGGKLWSYIAGTSTPTGTYQDSTGGTPNANPIILDANGECEVWITLGNNAYKFVLMDSNDVVQWTVDDVTESTISNVSGWSRFNVTDGQAATALAGITVDLSVYSSCVYDVEIIRGTATISNIPAGVAIQSVNGTGRVVVGNALALEDNGVTLSVTQVGSVAQLLAACNAGPGNGTVKLRQSYLVAA